MNKTTHPELPENLRDEYEIVEPFTDEKPYFGFCGHVEIRKMTRQQVDLLISHGVKNIVRKSKPKTTLSVKP